MNLNEAAALLLRRRDDVKDAIQVGIRAPSGRQVCLSAQPFGSDFEITDADLDAFIQEFERDEPGRHPPAAVRRVLLVEASHKCAICRCDAPLQFHHVIEWSRIKHHDPQHMLAICGSCHSKIGLGQIDPSSQRAYKRRLTARVDSSLTPSVESGPIRFYWKDLSEVIGDLHQALGALNQTGRSQFDLTEVNLGEKNSINNLGEEYFRFMREQHEPHFYRVREFLSAPENRATAARYHETVDELRAQLATHRGAYDTFEQVLIGLYRAAYEAAPSAFDGKRQVVNVVLSFMYFNCDIGQKP